MLRRIIDLFTTNKKYIVEVYNILSEYEISEMHGEVNGRKISSPSIHKMEKMYVYFNVKAFMLTKSKVTESILSYINSNYQVNLVAYRIIEVKTNINLNVNQTIDLTMIPPK